MALTDVAIRGLKATGKAYKVSDMERLYVQVTPKGRKFLRIRFSFNGKRNSISLGEYPYVSLADARKRLFETNELLAKGINPSAHKKAASEAYKSKNENTFKQIGIEWLIKQAKVWSEKHRKRVQDALEKDIFPVIGHMPIKDITASTILATLRKVEGRGALDTVHRLLQNCGSIFRYAIATDRAENDVSAALRGALAPAKCKHYATITEPKAVGQLLRDLDAYNGNSGSVLKIRTDC